MGRAPRGELPFPADALYGIQTERARQNFPISHLLPLEPFVDAVVWIKKAAALVHKQTGRLDPKLAAPIVRPADEVLAREHRHQFVGGPYQAGAGTSHHMNCNEVLAHRANEPLGMEGPAVGTGLNAEPAYPALMVKHLGTIAGIELREGKDRVQLMQSLGDPAALSGTLRTYAMDLGKIASDLRLLASGPRTGLAEIALPPVQPGSSIMPGKVNPSIPEMVNMVCYQVLGNDVTVAIAAEAGQLELNVMMPGIAHNLLFSMRLLTNASAGLGERCGAGVRGARPPARA